MGRVLGYIPEIWQKSWKNAIIGRSESFYSKQSCQRAGFLIKPGSCFSDLLSCINEVLTGRALLLLGEISPTCNPPESLFKAISSHMSSYITLKITRALELVKRQLIDFSSLGKANRIWKNKVFSTIRGGSSVVSGLHPECKRPEMVLYCGRSLLERHRLVRLYGQ